MINWILGITVPLIYLVGIYSGVDALMRSRHAQSSTAWILALVFIPFVTVPLYWALGRRGYTDYNDAQAEFEKNAEQTRSGLMQRINETCNYKIANEQDSRSRAEMIAFEHFSDLPFTDHNDVALLVNGEKTFAAIFDAIKAATQYVLIQFYIINDDDIGKQLQRHLLDAQERGVQIYLLYDKVGCVKLPGEYLTRMKDAGINANAFSGGRRAFQKFRLNFRNHRKIVVVDGKVGFIGGHNVGDAYLGRDKNFSHWRDTHMRVEGPAALALQMSFLRDWFFATNKVPAEMNYEPHCQKNGVPVQITSSGPHIEITNCGLLFAQLISSAEKRLWIATPYLVPDGPTLGALQLAAIRGVDVRLLVPRTSDNALFKFVPFAFIDDIIRAGGKTYFYEKGFMHQKILLIDDDYGVVSTANFDNRSFHLNFEITGIVHDKTFCDELESMLTDDFSHSTQITLDDVTSRPFLKRFATQATRLLAPIL